MGTLLSALTPDYAAAEQVSFNDPGITATFETFPSPKGHGEGYLVLPKDLEGTAPVVVAIASFFLAINLSRRTDSCDR